MPDLGGGVAAEVHYGGGVVAGPYCCTVVGSITYEPAVTGVCGRTGLTGNGHVAQTGFRTGTAVDSTLEHVTHDVGSVGGKGLDGVGRIVQDDVSVGISHLRIGAGIGEDAFVIKGREGLCHFPDGDTIGQLTQRKGSIVAVGLNETGEAQLLRKEIVGSARRQFIQDLCGHSVQRAFECFGDGHHTVIGVCSITVDPHKMGLAPIPAGGIIFRKEEYLDVMAVDSPYLTVKTQSTIVGTRLGASSAATYAIMKYFGKEGYCKLASGLMDNTKFLAKNLKELGYEIVCEPELNIVAFNHPEMNANDLAQKLEDLGWKVSVAKCPVAIRVVLMNHIKKNHLEELLKDLKDIF